MPIWGDEIRERAESDYRLKIAAVIAAETGRYPVRVRKPRVAPPPPEGRASRGVYELPFAPPGRRAFHIVASTGEVGYVDFPEHWANRDLVRNLWKRLDRDDPPKPELRIISGASDSP